MLLGLDITPMKGGAWKITLHFPAGWRDVIYGSAEVEHITLEGDTWNSTHESYDPAG